MKVVINAISAKMGGAVAYVRNFLPTLARLDAENEYVVFLQSSLKEDFEGLAANIRIESHPRGEAGAASRVLFDQWTLRRVCRAEAADCIFSTANFGILHPRAPQVLSVRNPVYFCRDYYRHVRRREGRGAEFRVAVRRRMVALSAASSAVVVTPSAAMREMLLEWRAADPRTCVVIPHGFDRETFLAMKGDPQGQLAEKLEKRGDERLLLYPSLYGKHKNFDTLIEGLAVLVARGMNVRLILTCTIDPGAGPYQRRTWQLIRERGLGERVTMLAAQPYRSMPRIYAAADVVVWPTFAESFGHPLLEAMASGKPIAASDLEVNREMAGPAALYFERFDPREFADKVEEALRREVAERLVAAGALRVGEFSWREHVYAFVRLFTRLAEAKNG